MSDDNLIHKLKSDVEIFHDAIIELIKEGKFKSAFFDDFPNGACRDTSEMLGVYLGKLNYKNIFYFSGELQDSERTHAWLKVEGYIVDITAYQFPEINTKIIVVKKSSFHKKFTSIQARSFTERIKYINKIILEEYKRVENYLK